MGPHLMKRPPKYVHGFVDRHDHPRHYFRRPGFKKVALPGLPWSAEFMAAYEAALHSLPLAIGAANTKPGSLRFLAISYYGSISYRRMKPSTRGVYRNILDRLCEQIDQDGNPIGDKRAAMFQRKHVITLMTARADKPESANGLRKVLRAVMLHAIEIRLRDDNPTDGVKAIYVKSDGYHSWTEDEIACFEQRHAIGSRPRLALALMLYTGQRRSDVVLMGRQHVRGGVLHLRQFKTGTELAIPVHCDLAAIVAQSKSGQMTFLVTDFGKPFTAAGFGNWFREQCDMANLRHCSAHGLRKAAARRLAEFGCTEHEIASITGHASLREVIRYTKAADQKRLAVAAIAKVETGTKLANRAEKVANSEK